MLVNYFYLQLTGLGDEVLGKTDKNPIVLSPQCLGCGEEEHDMRSQIRPGICRSYSKYQSRPAGTSLGSLKHGKLIYHCSVHQILYNLTEILLRLFLHENIIIFYLGN